MSDFFNSIKQGLEEAIDYSQDDCPKAIRYEFYPIDIHNFYKIDNFHFFQKRTKMKNISPIEIIVL